MIIQNEIHQKIKSTDLSERIQAVNLLLSNFAVLQNNEQAWGELNRLIKDESYSVRWAVAEQFGLVFPDIKDKNAAFRFLSYLLVDGNNYVKESAVYSLGVAFPHILDKEKAWKIIISLIKYIPINDFVFWDHKWESAKIEYPVYQMDEEEEDYDDYDDLLWRNRFNFQEKKSYANYVNESAAYSLGIAFPHSPNREQSWTDLHNIIKKSNGNVRREIVYALGVAYPYIPEKDEAFDYLSQLTKDEEREVQVAAFNSLGRASIYKATTVDNEVAFKSELEKALKYFEYSSNKSIFFNPSSFCLPFYRSFYRIAFNKHHESELEVIEDINEAEKSIAGSEGKEQLLEAIENIVKAIKEIQKTKGMSLETMQCNLEESRKYCEKACTIIRQTEGKAPIASMLLKMGLPKIDRDIKDLIEDLKIKAKYVCIETKNTGQGELAAEAYNKIKTLDKDNPIKFDSIMEQLIEMFKMKIPKIQGNEHIFQEIENLRMAPNDETLLSKMIPIVGAIPQIIIGRDQINIESFEGEIQT